jgi:glutaminyl-tRNA synthetase
VIDNWPQGHVEECLAPNHPQKPEMGKRAVPISGELWIEREDFEEVPPPKYFRLYPGNTVRLKYGYVVKCTGFRKDESGKVTEVHAEYFPDSKSGTEGADKYKTKGVIHWVCAKSALKSEVVLYDRLFKAENPGKDSKDYLDDLNPGSMTKITAYLEPCLADAQGEQPFQFERHGYFRKDRAAFARTVTLRDSWGR